MSSLKTTLARRVNTPKGSWLFLLSVAGGHIARLRKHDFRLRADALWQRPAAIVSMQQFNHGMHWAALLIFCKGVAIAQVTKDTAGINEIWRVPVSGLQVRPALVRVLLFSVLAVVQCHFEATNLLLCI